MRPIFLILLVALALRLWGITYALPQFFVNDERAGVYGALKMIELRTLVPAWHEEEFRKILNYLPLPSYVYLLTITPVLGIHYLFSDSPNLAAYQQALTLDPTVIFVTARLTVILLSLVSIAVTYRMARELFASERASLLAALFLAVSFYHIQLSSVTRQWMPALAALTLAWFAAARLFKKGAWRCYLWSGAGVGVAVGANPAAAVGLLVPILAHFLRPAGNSFWHRFRSLRPWAMAALAVGISLTFVLLWPYGLTQGETPGGTAGGTLAAKLVRLGTKGVGEWVSFLWYYATLLFTYETTLSIAALGGAVLAWRRHRSWVLIAGSFAVAYLSALYLFFNIIPRGALFLLPFLAAFAGYAIDRLLIRAQSMLPPTRVAFSVLFSMFFLLFFAWQFAVALRYAHLLTAEDTRLAAAGWIYRTTPADAKILADLPYLRLTNTKAGIAAMAELDPASLRVQDRVLASLDPQRYPKPSREVLNLHFLSPDVPLRRETEAAAFRRLGYHYLVVEYEYRDQSDLVPETRTLIGRATLLQRFDGSPALGRSVDISGEIATIPPWALWEVERFGQIVDVYAL